MLYVLGLISAFASFWFAVAALQTFTDAQPARPVNVVLAVVTALLAVGLFWAGRRWKVLLVLALAVGIGGAAAAGHVPAATAAGEQVVVTTDPPLSQIHPHGGPSAGLEPDRLIVEVRDASGRPLQNVQLDVQLASPETNWFISTDVPRIEGKTVLNWSAVAADGRQVFSYAFPIRGTYHLTVKAQPAPGSSATFTPISKTMDVSISEKPRSVLYLGLFLAALLTFGVLSGAILGRASWAGRAA
jgi:hypothetical protein